MERKRLSDFKRLVFSEGFIFAARTVVAFIFIYSGSVKIVDLSQFGEVITRYHILPQFLVLPFASFITVSEIILGFLFLFGVYEIETAVLLILLNLVFVFAMGSAIIRGIDTSCGCFAANGEVLGIKDILRDFVFILLILWVVVGRRYGKDND